MGKFTRKEGENVVRLKSSVQDDVEDDVTIIEDYVATIEVVVVGGMRPKLVTDRSFAFAFASTTLSINK